MGSYSAVLNWMFPGPSWWTDVGCNFQSNCCRMKVFTAGNGHRIRMVLPGENLLRRGHRMTTKAPSPWLMLPPVVEGGDMFYNFYISAEEPVRRLKKIRDGVVDSDQVPPDDAEFVGSSHGWLASFDKNSNNVFLSNPISGRHIKLPPVHTLPDPEINLLDGRGSVSRVILSCSPDDDDDGDCRAVMSFGPADRLAYCCVPGATEWTPVGELYHEPPPPPPSYSDNPKYFLKHARPYEDFVYSERERVFFCITDRSIQFEGWNLLSSVSERVWEIPASPVEPHALQVCSWLRRFLGEPKCNEDIKNECWHLKYLVVFGDDLFLVVRHVAPRVRPDLSVAPRICFRGKYSPQRWDCRYPYKTLNFDVYKVERDRKELIYLEEGSLGGLAMFVGMNHSFAVSPKKVTGYLKPGSIYFTDEKRLIATLPKGVVGSVLNFGGHDNGVFDYTDKSFSSYPHQHQNIARIVPPPMWFTPNLTSL